MQSVLVVDDDATIASGLVAWLSLEGIPSAIASDAPTAEAMIMDEFYPLVLADLRLRTHDDGIRLIEAIRRISPASRVAAMTGHATPEIENRVIGLGAATLLRKPFEAELFLTTVRALSQTSNEALYRETAPRLRAMMTRRFNLTSDQREDVLQQAWCVLLEKRREVRDVRTWLTGTVINMSRQAIHQCVRERASDAFSVSEPACYDDATMTMAVRGALTRLDARSRALCELIGLEQRSYAEVAKRLDVPIGSIGPLYMRAKHLLRNHLSN